MINFLLQM